MFADNIGELEPKMDPVAGAGHTSYRKEVMNKLHVATQWLITFSVFSALGFFFAAIVSGWLPTVLFSGVLALAWATRRILEHALRLSAEDAFLRRKDAGRATAAGRHRLVVFSEPPVR